MPQCSGEALVAAVPSDNTPPPAMPLASLEGQARVPNARLTAIRGTAGAANGAWKHGGWTTRLSNCDGKQRGCSRQYAVRS